MERAKMQATVLAGMIGRAVGEALSSAKNIDKPATNGGIDSKLLMELAFTSFFGNLGEKERYLLVTENTALRYATEVELLGYYLGISFIMKLLDGENPALAYQKVKQECLIRFSDGARRAYHRVLQGEITVYDHTCICPSGCTQDTLEASLWCLLTTRSYKEAILKAANLEGDSSIVGAITGLTAGIYYGIDAIPQKWAERVEDDIDDGWLEKVPLTL